MGKLIGKLYVENTLAGILSVSGAPVPIGDKYQGAYTVVPKVTSQLLETANKMMEQDVNVLEIPYQETSNIKGITVIIGGI